MLIKILDCWGFKLSRLLAHPEGYGFAVQQKDVAAPQFDEWMLITDNSNSKKPIVSYESFDKVYSGFIDALVDASSKTWKNDVFYYANMFRENAVLTQVQLCKSRDALPEKLCVVLDLAVAK
jgi:hypothetical protein